MRGIKDLHTLLFWMNNTSEDTMKKVLRDSRRVPKDKAALIRTLEREGHFENKIIPPKFENKSLNR